MESLSRFMHNNNHYFQFLGIAFLLLLVGCLLGWFLGKKLFPMLEKRVSEEKHPIVSLLLHGFARPVQLYFIVVGLGAALLYMTGWDAVNVPWVILKALNHLPAFVYTSLRIAAILCVTWGLLSSSNIAGVILRGAKHRLDLPMSNSVTRFLSGVFKVVVVAVATVVLLSEMHYDINGLIAGLGLGGLTIALAAKDSASNFFGGLILIIDKPFEIGDWVVCGDVEGTIEDINMRSTLIRNDLGSLTTVPNAVISANAITNYSGAMEKRRADISLALSYATTHKQLQEFVDSICDLLKADPEIENDSTHVRFTAFGESSLDVRVIFYTTRPGYGEYLRIRERVNFAIMDLAHQQEVQFAFPTRTVEFKNCPNSDLSPPRS